MKFREFLGSIVISIGMLMLKAGSVVTNAGFDLSGVSRDRVVELMTKMWSEDLEKRSQVVTHDDIVDRDFNTFTRAESRIETGDR